MHAHAHRIERPQKGWRRRVAIALVGLMPPLTRLVRARRASRPGKRLLIETVHLDEICDQARIESRARQLSEGADWDGLHRLMADLDAESGKSCGKVLTRCAARGTRGAQADWVAQLGGGAALPVSAILYDELERLELAYALRPDDHHLGAILTLAHLEMARVRQDLTPVDDDTGADGHDLHLARANEILTEWHAKAPGSGFLTMVAHRVACEVPGADTLIHDRFAQALEEAPTDWDLMKEHAFHLLPGQRGDYEMLELEARRTMVATPDTGAAAYAAFYMGVMTRDPGTLFLADAALLAQGLCDIARAEAGDPATVNRLLQFCTDITTPTDSGNPGADAEINAQRSRFAKVASGLFAEWFTCHVPECWTVPADSMRRSLAAHYAPLLEQGDRISLTRAGIAINPPKAAARSAT
ncbi:hypothetical protein [Tropicibacter oceani]|uniref:Uncharacterized protein n=1 Tax=Tropicibacter oceani TaxID=3058420 RepID=A0ABY8QMJ9_9RHOB|nr:hypothetical protein [Tropicibacter oceani]WGW05007.1 hypothetical protein QF118_05510 [Tropicibacter oceani]